MASLHLAGQSFALSRANALGVAGWRPLYQRFQPRADEIAPGLAAIIEQELDHLEANWPANLPQASSTPICFRQRLLPRRSAFRRDRLYFACNDALAFDIAIALNAWCFESDHAFNMTKARRCSRATKAVRALEPAEREALPLLARGAALRFLLTRAYDWLHTDAQALVSRKDPQEYLRRLKFHRSIDSASEYGLESTP